MAPTPYGSSLPLVARLTALPGSTCCTGTYLGHAVRKSKLGVPEGVNTFSQTVTLMIALELFSTSCLCCLRMKHSQHLLYFSRHVLVDNLVALSLVAQSDLLVFQEYLNISCPKMACLLISLAVIDG